MAECWKRLEKTYGDRTLNIVTVKNNLRSYQLRGSQRWERAIDLHECIEKAITQLEVLKAERSLDDDFELVSTLVSKLATDYQEEWDKFSISAEETSPVWNKFWTWLKGIKDRAVASKLRNMAAGNAVSKSELITCTKCKNKHRPGYRFCKKD